MFIVKFCYETKRIFGLVLTCISKTGIYLGEGMLKMDPVYEPFEAQSR